MFRVWDNESKEYISTFEEIVVQAMNGDLFSVVEGNFLKMDYEIEQCTGIAIGEDYIFENDVVGLTLANGTMDIFVVVYEKGTPILTSHKGQIPLKLDLTWDFGEEKWEKHLIILGKYRLDEKLREDVGVILDVGINDVEMLVIDDEE